MAHVASAKSGLIDRTRLYAQSFLHRLLRIVGFQFILVGIIRNKLLALRSRNLIMQHVRRVTPSRRAYPVKHGVGNELTTHVIGSVVILYCSLC